MGNTDAKTNGRNRKTVDALLDRVRDAIDATYLTGERRPNGSRVIVDSDDARAIRDYVRNQSMTDAFEALIDAEVTNERQHRKHAPAGFSHPISARQGTLTVILSNIGDGAKMDEMPAATTFIQLRSTAAEAMLVGYLARVALRADTGLLDALEALDYAAAVRS